jgi:hypothetical protein
MIPFSLAAGLSCPTHADFAVALAAVFHELDEAAVDDQLDAIAASLYGVAGFDAREQLEALTAAMAVFEPMQAPLDPRALLIDVALDRLSGHPTALAVIGTEVARRAGLCVGVVGAGRRHLVGHRHAGLEIGLDLGVSAVRTVTDRRAGWRCSHQVAFATLRELIERQLRVGDVGGALHAAELRLQLPLEDWVGERLAVELQSLRARLN